MFWKRPFIEGGWGSTSLHLRGPSTRVSLQTTFFIPSSGLTHGPAVSLQPPEAAMAISRPRRSASAAACLKASFQSGVIQTSRFSVNCGTPRLPSNICMPAMPTRFIHSRSAVMPSLVTLPLSQCHHARGLAESGGFLKPRCRASGAWATSEPAWPRRDSRAAPRTEVVRWLIMEGTSLLCRSGGEPVLPGADLDGDGIAVLAPLQDPVALGQGLTRLGDPGHLRLGQPHGGPGVRRHLDDQLGAAVLQRPGRPQAAVHRLVARLHAREPATRPGLDEGALVAGHGRVDLTARHQP